MPGVGAGAGDGEFKGAANAAPRAPPACDLGAAGLLRFGAWSPACAPFLPLLSLAAGARRLCGVTGVLFVRLPPPPPPLPPPLPVLDCCARDRRFFAVDELPDFPLLLPLLLPAVLDDAAPVVLEGAAVAPGQAGEEDDEDEVFLECDADPTPGLAPVLLPLPAPLPCTAGLLMAEARADPDLDDALEPAPEPLLPDVDPRDREDRDGGAEGRGRRRSGLRSGVARCGLFLISFLRTRSTWRRTWCDASQINDSIGWKERSVHTENARTPSIDTSGTVLARAGLVVVCPKAPTLSSTGVACGSRGVQRAQGPDAPVAGVMPVAAADDEEDAAGAVPLWGADDCGGGGCCCCSFAAVAVAVAVAVAGVGAPLLVVVAAAAAAAPAIVVAVAGAAVVVGVLAVGAGAALWPDDEAAATAAVDEEAGGAACVDGA